MIHRRRISNVCFDKRFSIFPIPSGLSDFSLLNHYSILSICQKGKQRKQICKVQSSNGITSVQKCQHAKERSSNKVGNLVIAQTFSSQTSNYEFTPKKNLSPRSKLDVNGRIEYFFFLNGMFLFIYGFRSIRNVEG